MKKTSQTSQKNTLIPRLVADDNGYADHKLAWLDEGGNIMVLKVPALIETGSSYGSTQGSRHAVYISDDVEYTCSSMAERPLNLRTGDYPVSVHNRVLLTHALTRAGLLNMPLDLAVTLPFRDYFKENGTINTALKEATAANFKKNDVAVGDSDSRTEIRDVAVYAEALSAFFDWAMDDKGVLTQGYEELCDIEGEMLIVDIGGSTTDLASIRISNEERKGQMFINHKKSGTEKVGVLDAKTKLEEAVRTALIEGGVEGLSGHAGKLPDNIVSRILERGEIRYSGQAWDLRSHREQACKAVAEGITRFISSKVGNSGSCYAILIVGGGAVIFRPWLEAMFPNAIFLDEFANARGALKFLIEKRARG